MDPIYTMAFILIVSETLDELAHRLLTLRYANNDFYKGAVSSVRVKLMKQRKSENADNTKQNKDLCTQPVCLNFGEEIFAMSSIYADHFSNRSFLNFQIVKFNCAFELFFNVRLKLMLHREDFPVHSDRFLALHYANKDRLKIALSSVSNGALVRLTYLLLVSSNVLCFYFDMTNEKRKSENADDTKQNNKRQKFAVGFNSVRSAEYVYANVNEGEHCRWHSAACTLYHPNPERTAPLFNCSLLRNVLITHCIALFGHFGVSLQQIR
ncbi:hypothetical protein T09_5461 [Trichinella sp. T9]|nr:hypothetical protein T09_5461 [Trichinella sp. T9]